VFAAGCSSDPASPDSTSADVPKVGTSYTYQGVTYDSVGHVLQSREIISIIAETGVSYFGKSNLVKLVTDGRPSYMGYESTDDLAQLFYHSSNGVVLDSAWVVYPFASRGSTPYPAWNGDAMGAASSLTGSIDYVGTQQLTIGSETFDTRMVRIESDLTTGVAGSDPVLRNFRIDTIWYAPSIRYIVKQSGVQSITSPISVDRYINVVTLKSYNLQ
jgi:hypothetical protein